MLILCALVVMLDLHGSVSQVSLRIHDLVTILFQVMYILFVGLHFSRIYLIQHVVVNIYIVPMFFKL